MLSSAHFLNTAARQAFSDLLPYDTKIRFVRKDFSYNPKILANSGNNSQQILKLYL